MKVAGIIYADDGTPAAVAPVAGSASLVLVPDELSDEYLYANFWARTRYGSGRDGPPPAPCQFTHEKISFSPFHANRSDLFHGEFSSLRTVTSWAVSSGLSMGPTNPSSWACMPNLDPDTGDPDGTYWCTYADPGFTAVDGPYVDKETALDAQPEPEFSCDDYYPD